VEQARVEEVRRQPPRLGLELAEPQHPSLQRELHELVRDGVVGSGAGHAGKRVFRLVSLNLNGIRSAAAKGFEAWAEGVVADCMGVQEIKAQAETIKGRFDAIAGMKGRFHFAEKKGYS